MARRRKPLGWPRYMVTRQLKTGVGYYWVPPTWAKSDGCPLGVEALGTDYGDAKKRCDDLLNPQLDAWRKRDEVTLPTIRATTGTFDWLVTVYKSSPKYQDLPSKTRKSYDAALQLASRHELKNGRLFGTLFLNYTGRSRSPLRKIKKTTWWRGPRANSDFINDGLQTRMERRKTSQTGTRSLGESVP